MAYSVEPLPNQPGQGNPVPDQPPLVKLKIYIVGGVFVFTTLSPHGDLPNGLPQDHKPHSETREPGTRVDSPRTVVFGSTSSAAALPTGPSGFGLWRFSTGST